LPGRVLQPAAERAGSDHLTFFAVTFCPLAIARISTTRPCESFAKVRSTSSSTRKKRSSADGSDALRPDRRCLHEQVLTIRADSGANAIDGVFTDIRSVSGGIGHDEQSSRAVDSRATRA